MHALPWLVFMADGVEAGSHYRTAWFRRDHASRSDRIHSESCLRHGRASVLGHDGDDVLSALPLGFRSSASARSTTNSRNGISG